MLNYRALGKIADFIEPTDQAQIKDFRDAVPEMVDVLRQCLDTGDVDGATKAFEVFDNLLMLVFFVDNLDRKHLYYPIILWI